MMPYNSNLLYQIERARRPDEIRYADEQAARIASASSSPFVASRGLCEPCAGHPRPQRAPAPPGLTRSSVQPKARCGRQAHRCARLGVGLKRIPLCPLQHQEFTCNQAPTTGWR